MAWFPAEGGGGNGEIKDAVNFNRANIGTSGTYGVYYDSEGNYQTTTSLTTYTFDTEYIRTELVVGSESITITFTALKNGTYEYYGMASDFSPITRTRAQKSAGDTIFTVSYYGVTIMTFLAVLAV